MKVLPPSTYPGSHIALEFPPGELVTMALTTGGTFEDLPPEHTIHLVYFTTGGKDAERFTTGGKVYAPGQVASVGLAIKPATREVPAFLDLEPSFWIEVVIPAKEAIKQ